MNTIDYRGLKAVDSPQIAMTHFPTVSDMSISGKALIQELQKMIDEYPDDSEGGDVHFGLKVAISTVEKLQQTVYEEFLSKIRNICKSK